MTTTPASPAPSPARRHVPQGGPPLLAPALAFAVLTVASLVLGAAGPRPGTAAAVVLAYDLGHNAVLTVAGTVVFGSAIPLAIWAATAYRRLRRLGITAPGTAMAFAGGMLASASLALSGLLTWTAAQSADPSAPGLARALTTLGFATGGPGFVVPFALLLAGVAVPVLILRLMPRWVAWTGLVIAALGMLATLSLLAPALYPLLPIGRFGGLIWLIAASVLLPQTRPHRTNVTASVREYRLADTTH
ncbi:MAG: DUF4386 domain-containing protein [Sciscionella sp.]